MEDEPEERWNILQKLDDGIYGTGEQLNKRLIDFLRNLPIATWKY